MMWTAGVGAGRYSGWRPGRNQVNDTRVRLYDAVHNDATRRNTNLAPNAVEASL